MGHGKGRQVHCTEPMWREKQGELTNLKNFCKILNLSLSVQYGSKLLYKGGEEVML